MTGCRPVDQGRGGTPPLAPDPGGDAGEDEPAPIGEPPLDRVPAAARPLRILTIAACPMPARRGTPVRIERLAEALAERGHQVAVATYHIGETPAASGYEIIRIRRRRTTGNLPPGPTLAKLLVYDPQLLTTTRRLLARGDYDVIHAHHFEGLIIGALARPARLPLVYDAHTMLRSELPSYMSPFWRPVVELLAGPLDRFLPRLADHVVCAGTGTLEALRTRYAFPEERLTLAVNGVELEHFAAAADARAASPAVDRPPRILYTGTLAAYQDIDLLLEAMARLHRTHGDARLVLATCSPPNDATAMAERLGITDRIELIPDDFATLPAELARATLAVLPRRRCDGVPQKLLNYMAAACPIVASAGSARLLQHEVTGLVVPDGDVAGFASAMARLIDRPSEAAALGARAHAVIARDSSWQATAATIERVYQRLLVTRAAPSKQPAY
jgi:glycosyltransferase involved in cell wall biosynthesis